MHLLLLGCCCLDLRLVLVLLLLLGCCCLDLRLLLLPALLLRQVDGCLDLRLLLVHLLLQGFCCLGLRLLPALSPASVLLLPWLHAPSVGLR